MDPVDILNRLPQHGGVAGMLLSSMPAGRVLSAYSGAIARVAPHRPAAVVDADASLFPLALMDDFETHEQVVSVFGSFLINAYLWVEAVYDEQVQVDLQELDDVRIRSLVDAPPVNVSGQLQHVFSVRDKFRGVAAVGRGSLDTLVARALVGLEIVASMALYDGPFFAIAFNGKAWCTLEWPAGYMGGGEGLKIQRREAAVVLTDPQQREAFIVNLRHAFLTAVDAEYFDH